MSDQNKKMDEKLIYQYLQDGDKLEKGDEYSSTNGIWREIPDCLIGDKIPKAQSDTQWRRIINKNKITEAKKHWYSLKK